MANLKLAATQYHPSYFENFRYVYPVVSRRAGGVSIGVNLSRTKRCTFRCVYCQVDRAKTDVADALELAPPSAVEPKNAGPNLAERIDPDALRDELTELARLTLDGELFKFERFANAAPEKRALRDFAFSGDGEPTLAPDFPVAVDAAISARNALAYPALKLVLITNSTRLAEPSVVGALDRFVANNGEIWAKLDGGDAARVRTIDRSAVPFERIVANLDFAARRWGVKIQTAALSWNGEKPTESDVERYSALLNRLRANGGTINDVQLYTVARIPTEPRAVALADAEMNALADKIRAATGLGVDVFYSK